MTTELVERVPVVFVLDTMRLGGSELNAVRTAELLDRKRFDLRVVCFNGDGPLTARYAAMGVPVVTMPLDSLYGRRMLSSGWRFSRYLKDERIRVVHAHDMYSNVFTAPWARLARVPVVIASRRWWHSLPNAKLQLGNRMAFQMATAVLANSPQVARSVVETDGVPEERVWTVTNFVDDRAFDVLPAEQRQANRSAWGIPEKSLVIGCVARLVPVKDHATLIHAFSDLRETIPAAHLVLIGDGESRPSLEALAMTSGVAGHITFAGELRGGENHHRNFDVSVLCSHSEGFPNSLVEAMAAGVPIVATRVGGIVDAVSDGDNGVLVPVESRAELTGALRRLAADATLRERMGTTGRAMARERYTAREAVRALGGMYDTLLHENRR